MNDAATTPSLRQDAEPRAWTRRGCPSCWASFEQEAFNLWGTRDGHRHWSLTPDGRPPTGGLSRGLQRGPRRGHPLRWLRIGRVRPGCAFPGTRSPRDRLSSARGRGPYGGLVTRAARRRGRPRGVPARGLVRPPPRPVPPYRAAIMQRANAHAPTLDQALELRRGLRDARQSRTALALPANLVTGDTGLG